MKPSASLDLIYSDPTRASRLALAGKFEVISATIGGRSSVSQSVYVDAVIVDEKSEDGERIVTIRISDHDAGRVGLGGDIDCRFSDIMTEHPDFDIERLREEMDDDYANPSFQDDAWTWKA